MQRHLIRNLTIPLAALAVFAAVACAGDDSLSSDRDGDVGARDGAVGTSGGKDALNSAALATPAGGKPQAPATGAPPSSGTSSLGTTDLNSAAIDRKIIFNADLDFEAADVRASFDDVARVARSSGGFVEKSSLDERPDRDGKALLYGALSLRVPSTAYGDVVADLRGLGGLKLRKESSSANEVTDQYIDLTSRLRNLERSETQYLALLQQAKTIQEILTVQERVDSVRNQIEQIQGRLKLLDDQTDLATIDVSLVPPAAPALVEEDDDGPKSVRQAFADAWHGAVETSRYVAAAGAVLLVMAIWLAVPAALVVALGIYAHRRSPGRPLDSAPTTSQ